MLTDLPVYILHLLFAHPFFYMVAYIISFFGTAIVMNKNTKFGKARYLYIVGFFIIFFNFFAGHSLNASLIHWAGEKGAAKITDTYATSNRVVYPSAGDEFNVSYLKHFPTAFVIITNDDSPWASGQSCAKLKAVYQAVINNYNFDRSNLEYRKACIDAIQNIISQHCYTDSTDLQKYKADLGNVIRGMAFN